MAGLPSLLGQSRLLRLAHQLFAPIPSKPFIVVDGMVQHTILLYRSSNVNPVCISHVMA
jgi:hypothetical protein